MNLSMSPKWKARFQLISRLKSFYHGAFYYTLAYTAFISLEFGIHDMLMESINHYIGSKDVSIIWFMLFSPERGLQGIEEAEEAEE